MKWQEFLSREQDIKNWIDAGYSKTKIAMNLGIGYSVLQTLLKHLNIQYNGVRGNGNCNKRCSAKDFLNKNKHSKLNPTIKQKLFKENLKEYKCEICGISEWQGKSIILQVHHIDGNPYNNTLENIQILCPNCHSQTDSYSASSDKRKRAEDFKKIKNYWDQIDFYNIKTIKESLSKINLTFSRFRIFLNLNPEYKEIYFEEKRKFRKHIRKNYKLEKEIQYDKIFKKILEIREKQLVDFTKFGWVNFISNHLNISPKIVNNILKRCDKDFYNSCYHSPGSLGKCWINNGIEIKKISKNDINNYILDGWKPGRKIT